MPFPVTTVAGAMYAQQAKDVIYNIYGFCRRINDELESPGSADSGTVLNLLGAIVAYNALSVVLMATPNAVTALLSYLATTEPSMSGLTTNQIGTMMGATQTAVLALQTAIIADYPKDGDGFLLDRKFDASGNQVPVVLGPGALSRTVPAITAFLATVQ